MLFASLDFVLFLPPVLAAYWLLFKRPKARFALLLCASYFFYCAGAKPHGGGLPPAWYFVGLLAFSTVVDFVAGLAIGRARARGGTGLPWLVLSLAANLGLLGYFKYTGFLLEVANSAAHAAGLPPIAPALRIALPIGISFYTFESISYTIDVWRGKLEPERSFISYALFISFFPKLIAGPILRPREFLPQIHGRLAVNREDVDFALFRITKGIVKKVLLGDFIAARFTDIVFAAPSEHSSLENMLALYAFTLQIYADFSGYTDVAIGVARLFGVRLSENFDRPYQAASVAEFWRRWHITLSTWLRDYLFFPLGGSRGSLARTCFNLWLTMFLIGMWHGASWNFVIYGNLQAAAIVLHRIATRHSGTAAARVATSAGVAIGAGLAGVVLARLLGLGPRALTFTAFVAAGVFVLGVLSHPDTTRWLKPLHVACTFHFVVLSRIFFRAGDLELARSMYAKLLEMDGLGVRSGMFRLHDLHGFFERTALPEFLQRAALSLADQGLLILLVLGLCVHFVPSRITEAAGLRAFTRAPAWGIAGAIALLGAAIPRLLAGPRPNIYFAF
jgi:D-alanyl-lipoteichoic acid acyltransferase DltB (MBOAT superfamily)